MTEINLLVDGTDGSYVPISERILFGFQNVAETIHGIIFKLLIIVVICSEPVAQFMSQDILGVIRSGVSADRSVPGIGIRPTPSITFIHNGICLGNFSIAVGPDVSHPQSPACRPAPGNDILAVQPRPGG